MWKKPILFMLVLVLGGAIAIVAAQEGSKPPVLQPPTDARPLPSVTADANASTTERSDAPSLPRRRWRSQEVSPASYGTASSSGVSYGSNPYIQDDEPEVPSILVGNRQGTSGQGTGAQGAVVVPSGERQVPTSPNASQRLTDSSDSTAAPEVDHVPVTPREQPPQRLLDDSTGARDSFQPRSPPNSTAGVPQPPANPTTGSSTSPGLLNPVDPSNTTQAMPLDTTQRPTQTPTHVASSNVLGNATTNPTVPSGGVRLDTMGAQLRVEGIGPSTIKVGKPAAYVLKVRNISNVVANDTTLRTRFPSWVTLIDATSSAGSVEQKTIDGQSALEWTFAEMSATSLHELNLQIIVTENRPFDLATELVVAPVMATSRIQVTQPQVEVVINGPTEINYGQVAGLSISVANSGNGDAENVVVTMPEALGGERLEIGTIAAGAVETVQVELTAREKGPMDVRAEVAADGGISEVGAHRLTVRRAVLDIDIQGPRFEFAGSPTEYKVVIQNSGDAVAQSVLAAAALPAGAVYEGGVASAEAIEGGIRWNIGDLQPGGRMQYSIICTLNQAGTARFESGVRDATDLAAADVAETTVEAVAELTLEVKDPKGPRPVGEEVIYELTIRNRGTKAATDVNVIAQFSEGIEPTLGIGLESTIADGQVLFQPIPRIAAGGDITVRIKAKAAIAGNHIFRAHVTCDDPDTHRVFEGTTRFFEYSGDGLQLGGRSEPREEAIPSTAERVQPELRLPR